MANVFRRRMSGRSLPPNAVIGKFSRNAVAEATWVDAKGVKHSCDVERDEDGTIVRLNAVFTAKYRDADGIVHTVSTGCTTQKAAEYWLQQKMAEEEKLRQGLITRADLQTAKSFQLPIQDVISQFMAALPETMTVKHRKETIFRINKLVSFLEITRLKEITQESVEKYINQQVKLGKLSYRTINKVVGSTKSLLKWCVRTKQLPTMNGVNFIVPLNEELDRRLKRRALLRTELIALLTCPKIPIDRRELYMFAVYTGLRIDEIRNLKYGHVVGLGTGLAKIELEAKFTKAKRADVVPLMPDLEKMLIQRMKRLSHSSDTFIFHVVSSAARRMRNDLKIAGMPMTPDTQGRVLDFHALRKTFVTLLAQAGVDMRTIQQLARHSSIELTSRTYTDETQLPTREAILTLNGGVCVSPVSPDVSLSHSFQTENKGQKQLKTDVHKNTFIAKNNDVSDCSVGVCDSILPDESVRPFRPQAAFLWVTSPQAAGLS